VERPRFAGIEQRRVGKAFWISYPQITDHFDFVDPAPC